MIQMSEEEMREMLEIILEYDLIDLEYVLDIPDGYARDKVEQWIIDNEIKKQ